MSHLLILSFINLRKKERKFKQESVTLSLFNLLFLSHRILFNPIIPYCISLYRRLVWIGVFRGERTEESGGCVHEQVPRSG